MREVEKERQDLTAVLAGLREDQWDGPTLCAGWRVREVVAHMTMPYRMTPPEFGAEMERSQGRFNEMADRVARRDAARMSSADLLALMRDNIFHPWSPPGGEEIGALSHDVIHGMDITVGLGLGRRVPVERIAVILDGMGPGNVAFFGTDLSGVSLRANDLDWSHGDGEPVTGAAQDLLLVLSGRRLPPGRLHGAGAGRFTR